MDAGRSGLGEAEARAADLRLGINGGFATPNPEYVYWGGFAVCGSDGCGPYGAF